MYNVPREFMANIKWRQTALKDAANSASARAAIRKACADDPLFFLNTFAWTYDPRKAEKRIPFTTYPYQDEAIMRLVKCVTDGRDAGIKKSRDMGASWVILGLIEWYWQFKDFFSALVVSRNENYVDASNDPKSLFWKIDFLIDNQPKWLKPNSISRRSMHIGNEDNGAVIDGESTTGEVARGDRRSLIMLDEFGSFAVQDGFNALAATQSATNCRIFNSTPKGSGNAFYEIIHHSAADIITMHWSQHPNKCKGLYTSERDANGHMAPKLLDNWEGVVTVSRKGTNEWRKCHYPEEYPFICDGKIRSPWYDTECSRAVTPTEIGQELDIDFVGSDYQFFDPIAIQTYKDQFCTKPTKVGDLVVDSSVCKVLNFTANKQGFFSLFEDPDGDNQWPKDRHFVIGVDVSAGTGASNSTAAIYDYQSRAKVAEYANPFILPDDFGRFVTGLAKWFNSALVIPDRSGPTGEVFVKRMLTEGYRKIYMRRNTKKLGAPVSDEPGVWLMPTIKTTLLQQYRDAIGHGEIKNRSSRAMDECLCFICKMDGTIEHSASANAHDPGGARANHGDIVIADALANLGLQEKEPVEMKVAHVDIPHDSVGFRILERRRQAAREASGLGKEWEP